MTIKKIKVCKSVGEGGCWTVGSSESGGGSGRGGRGGKWAVSKGWEVYGGRGWRMTCRGWGLMGSIGNEEARRGVEGCVRS